jgi:hypothetical protein
VAKRIKLKIDNAEPVATIYSDPADPLHAIASRSPESATRDVHQERRTEIEMPSTPYHTFRFQETPQHGYALSLSAPVSVSKISVRRDESGELTIVLDE